MAIMQAYQAHLLRDQDEGKEVGADEIEELHLATLNATKKASHAIWRSMVGGGRETFMVEHIGHQGER